MLEHILISARQKIESTTNLNALQQVKVEFLGKQSCINQAMKKLGQLDGEERKNFGLVINKVKEQIQQLLSKKHSMLEEEELNKRFYQERLDLTIPARPYRQGSIHPITQCVNELIEIFAQLGFTIKYGPDIESDWYNFTALNIDENHPARQMHDTFYLQGYQNNNMLLRTHTSPIQIRTLQSEKPPSRFIAPGRVYRSDSDMTHTPMFHQIEGLVIDKDIHMGHLKYVINELINSFFEQSAIEVRFRPSFFPFTEPSAEVDIRIQKSNNWLEVLGCGMVHPNVLRKVGIEPNEYQGFAFGLGIERFAMLKYGVKDLRQFFEGDIRWHKHYGFSPFDIPSLVGGLTK